MEEKKFWFERLSHTKPDFIVRPKNPTGSIVLIVYVLGILGLTFYGIGALILGDYGTAGLSFGLDALFILGGMRVIWAKTDPHSPRDKPQV